MIIIIWKTMWFLCVWERKRGKLNSYNNNITTNKINKHSSHQIIILNMHTCMCPCKTERKRTENNEKRENCSTKGKLLENTYFILPDLLDISINYNYYVYIHNYTLIPTLFCASYSTYWYVIILFDFRHLFFLLLEITR